MTRTSNGCRGGVPKKHKNLKKSSHHKNEEDTNPRIIISVKTYITMARGKRAQKRTTKPRARKAGRRKAMSQPEKATCSVVRTLAGGTTNTMFAYNTFNLADYDRAVAIARNYQRYRITGIKLTFKPEYDTFAVNPAGPNVAKPNLYYMIDKSGSIPDNVTLEGLKQAGAKPHAFDEKPISFTWKPSVLNETQAAGLVPVGAGYKISPLLSTDATPGNVGAWNPSRVNHLGVKWYMECTGTSLGVNVEAELQFEFYKAVMPSLSAVPSKGLQYAVIDQSPDGVEGGTDGITIPLT